MSDEAWLQGPIEGIPPLLMPVAHALVQARADTASATRDLTPARLWRRPGGAASAGFHVRHLAGSLDRLFTYARGEALDATQRAALAAEGLPPDPLTDAAPLVADLTSTVERALTQLRRTDPATLLDARGVGRAQLPSTVIGLLFHAAEHAQRHVGQIVTTAKVVAGESGDAAVARARSAIERLERVHGGDPWHGSSTQRILEGFDAGSAFLRPSDASHSACEIVLHATGWTREVARRLEGGTPDLPADGDWPEAGAPGDDRWRLVRGRFDAAIERLVGVAQSVSAEGWAQAVGEGRDAPLGSGVSVVEMLEGVVDHEIYHAGQMAMLRRLVATGGATLVTAAAAGRRQPLVDSRGGAAGAPSGR